MNHLSLLTTLLVAVGAIEDLYIPPVLCGNQLPAAVTKICTIEDYSSPCFGSSFSDPIAIASFNAAFETGKSNIKSLRSSPLAKYCCTGQCSRTLLERLCCNEIEAAVFKLTHRPLSSKDK